jgi:uncharacterized protein YbjT (DUF2867 family)
VAWTVVQVRRRNLLPVQVLVTGASGAIGAELIPRLAARGHRVRAFGRDPARIAAEGVSERVRGDAISGAGLAEALDGIDVAYFLIHSMETTSGLRPGGPASRAPTAPRSVPVAALGTPRSVNGLGTFAERDRRAADRFAAAAADAGVRRIVYLGGLVPAQVAASPHLASRLEVERTLMGAAPEAVALRASIVIGARSRSFRFLVRLVERVPVMALPAWRSHRTAPIDARDVIAFLERAGTSAAADGRLSLDIAGPDVVTYAELVERIRDALLLGRPRLDLPFELTPVASRVAAAIAGEDVGLVAPLMGSLNADLLPRDDRAGALFGVRVHRLDAAIERALRDWESVEQLAGR